MTRKKPIRTDQRESVRIPFFRCIRGLLPLFLLLLSAACADNSKLLLENAENAWAAGDRAVSIALFEDFLRRYPDNPLAWRAHYGLGNAYYLSAVPAERNLKKAEAEYQDILSKSPQASVASEVWKRIADIKAERGERFEAIAEYENLLLRFPNLTGHRRIRLTIANLYHDLGNLSQAETEYQKVADGSSYDELCESAFLRVASINQMRSRFEKAIPALNAVIANSKNQDVVHQSKLGLSDCLAKLGRYQEAGATLRSIGDPRPGERKLIRARLDALAKEEHSKPKMGEVDWRVRR